MSRDVLSLDPSLALWLVPEAEEAAIVWRRDLVATPGLVPDRRYRELASAQKIYYDPLSISSDIRLEQTFEALGVSAPSVEQARALFASVEKEVSPTYAFSVSPEDEDIWHVRNQSRPAFDRNPLLRHARWILFVQCNDETQRVVLEGEHVGEALAWLPLLDGHHTVAEVEVAMNQSEHTQRVAEAIVLVNAFATAPEEPFDITALPELLFVSHSSVLVRGDQGGSVLVDPAILPSTEMLSREGRRPFEIVSKVDAVIVSHCHWDHLSFQTMIRIPRSTTIYVPKNDRPALVNPPIRRYLEAFGFSDVREVSDWATARVGKSADIDITFVPFFGEPFGLESHFDAFTYLIRASGKTIYGSLDACHDEAGTMDPIIEELRTRLGRASSTLDVFLFGSSDYKHDPLYRGANIRHYSNELIRRPDMVRYHPNMDDVIRWSAVLEPKALVPYANFVYFGSPQQDDERTPSRTNLDTYWSGDHIPPYALPWKAELERLARARGSASALVMLHPMQGLSLR